MDFNLNRAILYLCLAWFLLPDLVFPQQKNFAVDRSSGQPQNVVIDNVWKFKSGDNSDWAKIDFDDSNWKTTSPGYFRNKEWDGIGWLRFKIFADTSLTDVPVGMLVEIQGAAEVYIDGKLNSSYGRIFGADADTKLYAHGTQKPSIFNLTRNGKIANGYSEHLIAVRISSYSVEFPLISFESEPYFNLLIGDIDSLSDFTRNSIRITTTHQMLLLGIFLAFSILHFLLYLSYPEMKANLFFTLITLSVSAIVFGRFEMIFAQDPTSFVWYFRIMNLSTIILFLSIIKLLNHLLERNNKKANIIYLTAAALWSGIILLNPFKFYSLMSAAIVLGFIEILRIIVLAFYKKERIRYEGSWIILVGFIPICLVAGYEIAVNLELSNEAFNYTKFPIVLYSMLILVLSMSIFLSRNFAKVNANLKLQLEQVKILSEKTLQQEVSQAKLEAENKRKSDELESARQLQLSMLPKELPEIEHLDIVVKMSTATEVGGDYYDFLDTGNNSFVGVFGDATGHGLRSGSVVTATKSLFKSLGKDHTPSQILADISAALKLMGFDKLFMALTSIRYQDKKLIIASAGMPFLLYYNSAEKKVFEVGSPGIPLGMMSNIEYKEDKLELKEGDTLLFMSDGYPELFNPAEEMFGYDRCHELFESYAENSAMDIMNMLIENGREFAEGRPADDDITLMIIKCKS